MSDLIVAGKRLETFEARVAGRPTIVFLHEGLGSISLWRDFPLRVAERTGCGIFAYSRYGYGNSESLAEKREPTYMHREADVVLPAVLEAARIERPILLGHSDGASIALLFAAAFPGAARGLILEAPHVFVEDVSVRSIAAANVAFETTDLPKKLARHHADARGAFRGWNDIWLDARFRAWNIEDGLERITEPMLVLQGVDDEYGTGAQLRAIEARVRDVTTVLLDSCAHSPHRDRPDAVLDALANFVAGIPP